MSSGSSQALLPLRRSVPATRRIPRSRTATISTFGAARPPRTHPDTHFVAVHRAADGLGRHEDVIARSGRREARDEPKPARMNGEKPVALGLSGGGRLSAQLEALPGARRQHALQAQVVEQALQAQVVDLGDVQPRGDLTHVKRPRLRPKEVDDLASSRGARGHRTPHE